MYAAVVYGQLELVVGSVSLGALLSPGFDWRVQFRIDLIHIGRSDCTL